MTPEGRIVAFIRRTIRSDGGQVRKCEWAGHAGAPDLFVMYGGRHWWIECKAPGESPRAIQRHEFSVMQAAGGCSVLVFDSEAAFSVWWLNMKTKTGKRCGDKGL